MGSKSNWSKNRTENVIRWLSVAIRDRGAANSVFYDGYLENAVYNLQQSSEKLLKAFLVANDETIDKTHEIDSLLVSAGMIDPQILRLQRVGVGSAGMTKFATRYRYPNWDKDDFAEVDEVLGASEFSDALYAYLKPFFGDEIIEMALSHSRVKSNVFETGQVKEEGKNNASTMLSRPKI